jgi:hypothetical protein
MREEVQAQIAVGESYAKIGEPQQRQGNRIKPTLKKVQ